MIYCSVIVHRHLLRAHKRKPEINALTVGLSIRQQTLKQHRRKQPGAGYEKDIWHKCMVEGGLKFMQVKSLNRTSGVTS